MSRRRRFGQGPRIVVALVALLVLALIVQPFVEEDAPNPCSALERRVEAAALLRQLGAHRRFGRAASAHRLPYVPP